MRINMNLRVPTYKESPFFTLSEINNSEIFLQICAFLSIYPLNAVKCFHRKGRASGHCKDTAWWREALGSAGWLPLPHYWGFKHLCTHVCLLLWSPVELFCSRAVWEEWPGPIFAKGFQKIAKVRAVLAWLVSSQFSWVWAGQKGSTGAVHGALMSFFIWGSTIQRCFCKFHSMADGRSAPSKAYILHHPMDIRIMESFTLEETFKSTKPSSRPPLHAHCPCPSVPHIHSSGTTPWSERHLLPGQPTPVLHLRRISSYYPNQAVAASTLWIMGIRGQQHKGHPKTSEFIPHSSPQ